MEIRNMSLDLLALLSVFFVQFLSIDANENVIPSVAKTNSNLRLNNNGLAASSTSMGVVEHGSSSGSGSSSSSTSGSHHNNNNNLNYINVDNNNNILNTNINNNLKNNNNNRKLNVSSDNSNRIVLLEDHYVQPPPPPPPEPADDYHYTHRRHHQPPFQPQQQEQSADAAASIPNKSNTRSGINNEFRMTNVTTQLQTHAYLPCKLNNSMLRVKQVANKSVSWVRVRDDHILTVDRITFIADERFQSYYVESNGIWTLQIKYVQARDAGIYECQVSTEPKMSAQVQLNVVVPKTELIGEPIRYVKGGSNVILRCVVRGALEPPIYISWFYGTKQIYNDNARGWKTTLDKDVLDSENGSHSSIGSLIISSVRKRDTGNYTCSPSNSDPVTVMLHVINGEYSASAITSSSSRGRFSDLIVTIIISVAMLKMT